MAIVSVLSTTFVGRSWWEPSPVATTVTRISSSRFGSITVPTTTVASSDANSSIVSPTSANSPNDRFSPAAIFTSIPRAPSRFTSSNNGDLIADSEASRALSSPLANPVPIIAMPISDMTVLTSAKSTLIVPGCMIKSAIPFTAPNNTLLAALNASSREASLPSTSKSFSFGMVISESTCSDNSAMPFSAIEDRFLPSKGNGFVTTATVRMPISFATSATIGVAPVPVPPPIPAVMNTISAPDRTSAISSLSSIAACLPISGFAPAPNPLVILLPNCKIVLVLRLFSAWASVLAQINSTPSTSLLII